MASEMTILFLIKSQLSMYVSSYFRFKWLVCYTHFFISCIRFSGNREETGWLIAQMYQTVVSVGFRVNGGLWNGLMRVGGLGTHLWWPFPHAWDHDMSPSLVCVCSAWFCLWVFGNVRNFILSAMYLYKLTGKMAKASVSNVNIIGWIFH